MRAAGFSRSARIAAALLAASLLGVAAGTMAEAQSALPAWSSYDDDIVKANREKAQQQQAAADLRNALSETDRAIADATVQLDALKERLPVVQEEYRLAKERFDAAILQQQIVADKLAAAEAQDEALTRQMAADDATMVEMREILAELARAEYRGEQQDSALSIVLGATTSKEIISDFAYRETTARVQSKTLADLEELAAVNRNRQTRQEAVKEYIEELKRQADELVAEAEIARVAAEEKKAEVERLTVQAEELKVYLESKREEYLAQQAELAAAQAALQTELEALWQKKLAEEAVNGTGSLEKGFFSPPTAVPYITSPYGYRIHPIYGSRMLHSGTDFRAYCGTAILAAADGQVEWAKSKSGYGNQVMLDHGLISNKVVFTSYNHLTSFAVSPGQNVSRGQVVGYSGSTGTSTACHLHFEVYVNGSSVNPMNYVADW